MVSAHPRMLDPVPIAAMLLHAIVRARRKHGGEQGHPEEAESHPEEGERRRRKGIETAEGRRRETAGAPLRRGKSRCMKNTARRHRRDE